MGHTHKSQSHDLVTNVDQAEAQIVQSRERSLNRRRSLLEKNLVGGCRLPLVARRRRLLVLALVLALVQVG
jgi:hypothetical protein